MSRAICYYLDGALEEYGWETVFYCLDHHFHVNPAPPMREPFYTECDEQCWEDQEVVRDQLQTAYFIIWGINGILFFIALWYFVRLIYSFICN